MAETTQVAELAVPDEALRALNQLAVRYIREFESGGRSALFPASSPDHARAVATPVVAAELRDLLERAAALDLKTIDGLWALVSKRADQLDPS